MNYVIILLVLMLSGCATDKPLIIDNKPIIRPLPSMLECEQLTKLDSGTREALVNKIAELASIYKECALLNKEKKEWIERGVVDQSANGKKPTATDKQVLKARRYK
jgi:hypothetical protein